MTKFDFILHILLNKKVKKIRAGKNIKYALGPNYFLCNKLLGRAFDKTKKIILLSKIINNNINLIICNRSFESDVK